MGKLPRTPQTANEHEAKTTRIAICRTLGVVEDREADHLFGVVRVQFVTRT